MSHERPLEGKNLLFYGATSKIAQMTARQAIKEGAHVVGFGRNPEKLEPLVEEGIETIVGDITNMDDVMDAALGRKIDATVNFAANFNQSADYEKSKAVNVDGEEYVLRATEEAKIPRHVFISTLGTLMRGPNAYRDTKLEAEKKVILRKSIPERIILRYANIIGVEDAEDLWNKPFTTRKFGRARINISKIPSKKGAMIPYLGAKTAVDATLAALYKETGVAPIEVLDGYTSVENYLNAIYEANDRHFRITVPADIMISVIKAANSIYRARGKYFPLTPGVLEMIKDMPEFDNSRMRQDLGVSPATFDYVMKERQMALERNE